MKQFILAIIITILTSLFFFPFVTPWSPMNTKMVMAVIGLGLMLIQGAQNRQRGLNQELVSVSAWGLLVSLLAFASSVINNTSDFTYATYFVSMWVWMAAAYTVIKAIDYSYGKATFKLVANFLIAICVAQCILAQIINNNESVKDFIDSIMVSEGFMGKREGRLYGLGCALDVAGLKFSAILIIISHLCLTVKNNKRLMLYYLASFAIITVFGSMISRTASFGAILAIVYLIFSTIFKKNVDGDADARSLKFLWNSVGLLLVICLPIIIYFYNNNEAFHDNLRFGFEGFFSLFETGRWEVHSNEQLVSMWYFPDNLKTWLIGDGYFNSPDGDLGYVGESYEGYYMGTDVGYSRFIFYFGLLGLAAFIGFFVNAARICTKNMPVYALVFWFVLAMNFIGWCKVSTDIFPVFAIFLMMGKDESLEPQAA